MFKKTGWGFAITALIVAGALYAIARIDPQLGIDLQGGTELTYELDLANLPWGIGRDTVADTVKDIISTRLDAYGLKEISIATQGKDRIVVQIPGVSDSGYIKQQVENAGNLEFMLLAPEESTGRLGKLRDALDKYNREEEAWAAEIEADPQNPEIRSRAPRKPPEWEKLEQDIAAYNEAMRVYLDKRNALTGQAREALEKPEPPEWVIYPEAESVEENGIRRFRSKPGANRILHFPDEYRVSGKYLEDAYETPDENGLPAIGFKFNSRGATEFGQLTGDNIGRGLSIVLDERIIQTATIRDRISVSGQISGDFTHKEVQSVVNILRGGSLPTKPRLISESTVGSMLGRRSIEDGTIAVVSGLIIVLVFMLVYYTVGGVVANVALILNMVLILAYILVFRQTLTLPGIAGIILTIGMAVDANILIFERVREELRKGKSLIAGLGTGYQRAFWVIFDSNLTTLITGIVLFRFGTGPIKGFAVTLIAGIVASFFTAVFVTRLLLSLMINLGILKDRIRMLSLIGVPRVAFQSYRKPFLAISLATIVATWGLVIYRGSDNYGVDFNGGSKITMKLAGEVDRGDLVKWINELKSSSPEIKGLFENFSIQTIDSHESGKATNFTILVRSRLPEKQAMEQSSTEDASAAASDDETREQAVRLRVRQQLTSVLQSRDLLLPEPFPVAEDDLWVPAPSTVGGSVTPGELGLKLRVNLLAFEPPDVTKSPEEALKDLLNLHLEEIFEGRTQPDSTAPGAFKGIQVASVEKLHERPLVTPGRKLTTFEITTTGYQEPAQTLQNLASSPTHREVEETVMDFFRNESPVLPTDTQVFDLAEPFPEVVTIGSRVASNLQRQAVIAFFIAIVAIIFYLSLRFEFSFGLAAIAALVHDVLIAIGLLALTDVIFGEYMSLKINLPEVAALLTIVGYSVNDTIVVFDRIRENLRLGKKNVEFDDLVNMSINQTLSRTVWTSVTTLVVVLMLLALGGDTIKGFAFTFAVGLVTGTYSSVFVASPALVFFRRRAALRRERIKAAAQAS